MTDFVQLEKDLIELIACDLFDAAVLPDTEAGYSRDFTRPKVYVSYTGSDYEAPDNLAVVSQKDNAGFEFIIRAQKKADVHTTARIIATRLQGYKFPRFDKITLTRQGFIDGQPNAFNYMLGISMTGICMEQQPEQYYNLLKTYEVSEV